MEKESQIASTLVRARTLILGTAFALFVLAVLHPTMSLGTSKQDRWYHTTLAMGKTAEGYQWAVGAKGRKGHTLDEICATLSMSEPPRPDVPYVEGTDSADCGSVRYPTESIRSSVSMGSVEVVEILYRPVVRKVRVVLNSGEESVVWLRVPQISRRAERDIPMFRFFALPLEGDACIRRITSYDGRGNTIKSEKTESCS
jgi:hypothetical protein